MAARDPSPDESGATTSSESPRLREAVDRFVSLWGDMASTWGINRTMAKIHALLYCVDHPLNTDEIMERLSVSRGNANMNLRSLVDWDLVSKTRQSGSRKDYYEAEKDVWHITARIIEKRQRQEVQPVREQLQECADLLAEGGERVEDRSESEELLYRRFRNLIELMEMFEAVSEALLPLVQEKDVDRLRRLTELARALGDVSSAGSEQSD